MSKDKCKNCKLSDEDCSFGCDKENLSICNNGVYEYDTGRRDYFHQCQEIYRIYVYRKIRKYYRCLINQVGTDRIIHENISGKWIRENCKYIGQAHTIWEDLFKVKVGDDGNN